MSFFSLDLFKLRHAYLECVLKPSEVIEEILRRIDRSREYNIWISVRCREELLAEARKLEQREANALPLYGIPFAVKDNIDVRDLPTTAACPAFSRVAEQSAFAVRLLIEAGAILIGKTNLDQFATGLTGTRSPEPFGICRNAIDPNYISGGSSSGSAVAVAMDQVSFSLGTDTAGSGRIPAAFNNLIGFKPSRGLIGCSGIVPACRSLDCVSVFTRSVNQAELVFQILNVTDSDDVYARSSRDLLTPLEFSPTARWVIGIPKPEQLEFFGDPEGEGLFRAAVDRFKNLDAMVEEIDFAAFFEAANMLYEGPWIAERHAGIRAFLEANPGALHPVTASVFDSAVQKSAIQTFEALHRLAQLKQQCNRLLATVSCVVVPTAPRIYRVDEVLADPVAINTRLGLYTNYMNLLDLAAVAAPAGSHSNGLPFGITLFSNALSDLRLLELARQFLGESREDLPGKEQTTDLRAPGAFLKIAVCGAHMRGLPLNGQLLELGARFVMATRTSANYRFYALNLAPPARPGLVRAESGGASIELEIWELPNARFGDFLRKIRSPLCIGSVELEDGRWEYGFLCEAQATANAVDITACGGWRVYLAGQ